MKVQHGRNKTRCECNYHHCPHQPGKAHVEEGKTCATCGRLLCGDCFTGYTVYDASREKYHVSSGSSRHRCMECNTRAEVIIAARHPDVPVVATGAHWAAGRILSKGMPGRFATRLLLQRHSDEKWAQELLRAL